MVSWDGTHSGLVGGKPTFWKNQMPPSSGEKGHSPSTDCHYCHENFKTSQLKIWTQNRLESNPWTINTNKIFILSKTWYFNNLSLACSPASLIIPFQGGKNSRMHAMLYSQNMARFVGITLTTSDKAVIENTKITFIPLSLKLPPINFWVKQVQIKLSCEQPSYRTNVWRRRSDVHAFLNSPSDGSGWSGSPIEQKPRVQRAVWRLRYRRNALYQGHGPYPVAQ